MIAGSLVPDVRTRHPGELTEHLHRAGLPFHAGVVSLEPEFVLVGGRRHEVRGHTAAAWFYRSTSADLALGEAFEGRLAELGSADEVRTDPAPPLHIFRKTTQTIVCWQDGPVVRVFASTLPTEQVVALARRQSRVRISDARKP
jgi:hypothetical protein